MIGEIYLPAGELRFRLQIGVFSRCGPPSSRLRRDAASSFVIGFRWRVEQFALPIPLPDATVFSCDSFSPRPSGPACDARSRALHRWLETPCALRLGEPNLDGVTSGILCRTAALTQELLSCLRQDAGALHLTIKPTFALRRARTLHVTACLRRSRFASRTPSIGLMPNVAVGPSLARALLRIRVQALHPFEDHEPTFRVREEPPCPSTRRYLGSPRGSPQPRLEDASHRPLQPTFITSTRRSPDSRARSSRRDDRALINTGAFAPMLSNSRRPDRFTAT